MDKPCRAYAIGYLRDVELGPEIVTYMREIDDTLRLFDGNFVIHGGQLDALEGDWEGAVVVIEFPSRDAALRWYRSPEYQRILPLRTGHSSSIVAIVEGVPPGHSGAKKAQEIGVESSGAAGN